jgi:hypothetical protein
MVLKKVILTGLLLLPLSLLGMAGVQTFEGDGKRGPG